MVRNNIIDLCIKNGDSTNTIVRKIFLGYPTKVFVGKEDRQFEIIQEICKFFNVPYNTIQVVGSAKIGHSYFKNKDFDAARSDLDIAVIDKDLYISYMEKSFAITNGYTDNTKFTNHVRGGSNFAEYRKNLTKGFFRPDLMPDCKEKADWRTFFHSLSTTNKDLFVSINAGIYLNQVFFESKQKATIDQYKSAIGVI